MAESYYRSDLEGLQQDAMLFLGDVGVKSKTIINNRAFCSFY
jgi:hypothetical protein